MSVASHCWGCGSRLDDDRTIVRRHTYCSARCAARDSQSPDFPLDTRLTDQLAATSEAITRSEHERRHEVGGGYHIVSEAAASYGIGRLEDLVDPNECEHTSLESLSTRGTADDHIAFCHCRGCGAGLVARLSDGAVTELRPMTALEVHTHGEGRRQFSRIIGTIPRVGNIIVLLALVATTLTAACARGPMEPGEPLACIPIGWQGMVPVLWTSPIKGIRCVVPANAGGAR